MVMRIADDEIVVAADAQAAGPAIAIVRRGPRRSDIIAVAVVDLNPRGEVDNIKAIVLVDGDSPWPHQVAVLHAFLAPDNFRRVMVAEAAEREWQREQEGEQTRLESKHVNSINLESVVPRSE